MTVPAGGATTALVIGGGPAGAATAHGLARAGIQTLLIERTDGRGNPIGESLGPSIAPLLQRLGLWDALAASRPLAVPGNRSSWAGDGALADHAFVREPAGQGWRLDRPAFNRALLAAAGGAGADVWLESEVVGVDLAMHDPRVTVRRDDGVVVDVAARIVIDASGRRSLLSRSAGAAPIAFDRLAAAVVLTGPSPGDFRDATTLVEADPGGWWYSGLAPGGRLILARFSDPDLLVAERAHERAAWPAILAGAPHTQARLAAHGGDLAEAPAVHAAGSAALRRAAGPGWLAVGDAAAAHDPLSSRGIASALKGAMRATGTALAMLGGDDAAAERYARDHVAAFTRYLTQQQQVYAAVTRWPDAPFWLRRRTIGA